VDVQEYLRPFQQPWKPGFDERLGTLPPELSAPLEASQRSSNHHRERELTQEAVTDLLHASTPETRRMIAAVFFPQFPDVAARTLDALLTRHPYPQGYARRAFRAPGHRLAAAHAQTWLWQAWNATREYPQPIEWFAVHAGLLNAWQSHGLGLLLGQAISDGNEDVYGVLRDTAGTQHPVARMGRHVPGALLSSTREDAWTLAEGLLLAAQRQEGLRQVILETVDEASPDAFTRTLRLILQEDLLRFAATLRAACVWFGLNYDVTDVWTVRAHLTQALAYLDDPAAARAAVPSGSGVDAYLALFTLAMRDAVHAADLARPLLTDADAARRMAAAQYLLAAELLTDDDRLTLLRDPDLRLAALAGGILNRWGTVNPGYTFEAYEAYALRLPESAWHEGLLFPWLGQIPARESALDALPALRGDRPFTVLAPHLGSMSVYGKTAVLRALGEQAGRAPLDGPARALLLTLLQDRNSSVSQEAVTVMAHFTPDPAEIGAVHTLLKRKSADLRRGLIRLLASDPVQAQTSAHTLLGGNTDQRQAGLQLLIETGGTLPGDFRPKNITEETLLARLTDPGSQVSLQDGLGLFDPSRLTRPAPLQARTRDYPAELQRGAALLRSLDALIVQHRETPLVGVGWDGSETVLLGNVSPWHLRPGRDGQPMPLDDLWQAWWRARPDAQDGDLTRMRWTLAHFVARTDTTESELQSELDGTDAASPEATSSDATTDASELEAEVLDLLGLDPEGLQDLLEDADEDELAEHRATVDAAGVRQDLRRRTLHRTLGPLVSLRLAHPDLARVIVDALHDQHATPTDTEMALDAWETALSYLPTDVRVHVDPQYTWRREDPRDLLHPLMPRGSWITWTAEQVQRLWNLILYRGQAFPNLPRQRPDTALLLHAYAHGWANRDDLLDQLIGGRPEQGGYSSGNDFRDLSAYTRRTVRADLPTHPDWLTAVHAVRERVLEVELARGDLETPATLPALALQARTARTCRCACWPPWERIP